MYYRILYVIGNGFDLGLGLETSYKTFLEWYLNQPQSDAGNIFVESMRKSISADLRLEQPTWADAEMAFAKMRFSDFGADVRKAFSECRNDFTKYLFEYVRQQEGCVFKSCSQERLDCVRLWFAQNLFEVFRQKDEIFWPWEIGDGTFDNAERIEVEFISLNYTKTLERLLPTRSYNWFDCKTGKLHEVVCGTPYHLHGDADPRSSSLAAFGVSFADDIEDRKLQDLSAEFGYLLKPEVNRVEYAEASKMINRADCIVLMGTSCGFSDGALWNMILNCICTRRWSVVISLCCFGDMGEEDFLRHADAFGGRRDDVIDRVFETARGIFRTPDGAFAKDDPLRLGWIGSVLKGEAKLEYPPRQYVQEEFRFV